MWAKSQLPTYNMKHRYKQKNKITTTEHRKTKRKLIPRKLQPISHHEEACGGNSYFPYKGFFQFELLSLRL